MDKPSFAKLALQGATVLTPSGWFPDATVLIEDGQFVSIDQQTKPSGYVAIDVTGFNLLPGIVDIHGDAFERMICPRPGVNFPLEMAIAENDRTLLSAGITTFFYSVTDSFEPGLRSRDTVRRVLEIVSDKQTGLQVDSRIHVRHEQANTADHKELCDWLEQGKIQLLSLNNHLPPATDDETLIRYTKGLRQRIKLSDAEIRSLIEAAMERQEEGLHQVEHLVKVAHQNQIPVASHDDETEVDVALSARRGVAIAEFPASIPLAKRSQEYGAAVLMGAPNLVRGGSHVGYMSVADAVQAGVVDCLCSDYHYPSLFNAPFKLALGLMSFEAAWKLVSTNPAKAAGIGDRKGSIVPGLDADFLLVKPDRSLPSAIASVYIKGQEVARYS
ncbi:alpha-D-ribose 1-methylphosphonate 5-triphosphate diphosphatase [Oscillatoria sp. FACHB-1407]|uniref:alpha-D-ribose 1-methylphosphonate 5-triphosphate diphosphatase n=1 Tax=Oscillatoria sp. FACHB-1407 TaxID=2692847 RepID=UPI001688617B|nr:alpha-D-ribose 1-methylphosphonate 5-triphosphate diphosphatase [Oscillatoria sp. FACHB-1407]MBD2464145.1 alpha-D-ribose 1-methylphosphonate 5-triphosphate diphosphatase [Oscillatoria sp. FACHB-1407]